MTPSSVTRMAKFTTLSFHRVRKSGVSQAAKPSQTIFVRVSVFRIVHVRSQCGFFSTVCEGLQEIYFPKTSTFISHIAGTGIATIHEPSGRYPVHPSQEISSVMELTI